MKKHSTPYPWPKKPLQHVILCHLFFDHVLSCTWMIDDDDHLYKSMICLDAQQTLIQHDKS